jgi:hypothetical protein
MDFSRLNTGRVAAGAIASAVLIVAILFFSWYSYDLAGVEKAADADDWLCGVNETSCTAWETFPILRWLLLLLAAAPLILAYILVRGHKLSYPPGEMTMISGFAGAVLIFYNGVIDKPGKGPAEIGLGLDWGYWVALLCALVIAVVGFTRSLESGPKKTRKAPGTV